MRGVVGVEAHAAAAARRGRGAIAAARGTVERGAVERGAVELGAVELGVVVGISRPRGPRTIARRSWSWLLRSNAGRTARRRLVCAGVRIFRSSAMRRASTLRGRAHEHELRDVGRVGVALHEAARTPTTNSTHGLRAWLSPR
jgi:hypothetical protein